MKGKNARRFVRTLFRRRIAVAGAVIILVFFLFAVASPLIAPHDPDVQDLRAMLEGPSAAHPLGTDNFGRDLFSRIVYGARVAFLVGILAVMISAVIGSVIGVAAGYFGGVVDSVLMRIMEAMMAIPPIMLTLALAAVFGHSITMLTVILGISAVPTFARMMRGQVLSVKNLDYVTASRIGGNSSFVTMARHIFPNCTSPIIILMSQNIGGTILAEAGLSYLGVGVMPPTASWGGMVNQGYPYLTSNPVFALAPGVCIILLVLAFNIVGDGLRDALDPRLRGDL